MVSISSSAVRTHKCPPAAAGTGLLALEVIVVVQDVRLKTVTCRVACGDSFEN